MHTLEQCQLLSKHATAAVTTPIVVAEDEGLGIGERAETPGQAQVSIAEISNEQNGIRLKLLQQRFVSRTPRAVQITSDGKT